MTEDKSDKISRLKHAPNEAVLVVLSNDQTFNESLIERLFGVLRQAGEPVSIKVVNEVKYLILTLPSPD